MKKQIIILAFALVVAVSCASFAIAEEMQEMENGQQGGGMQGMGGEKKMNPMMMGMMHKDSMIATSDGGVIVMSGPRLIKYDKDLTLVKEVELPKGKKPQQHTDEAQQNQNPQ